MRRREFITFSAAWQRGCLPARAQEPPRVIGVLAGFTSAQREWP
jgi:hypothetical protein